MPFNVATIQVVGNLTGDAKATPMQDNPDRIIVDLALISDYREKDRGGQWVSQKGNYYSRVWMSRKQWDAMSPQLTKGKKVYVYGELQPKAGEKHTFLNIVSGDVVPLDKYVEGAAAPVQNGLQAGPTQPSVAAAPTARYRTDPQYPGYAYDTQIGQWVPAPAPAPVAPPPPPPAPPAAPPAGPPMAGPPSARPSGPPPGIAGPPPGAGGPPPSVAPPGAPEGPDRPGF